MSIYHSNMNLVNLGSSALGYGRAVNVQQHYLDHCSRILDHPRATPADGQIVAEIQLFRITLKLQHTPQRLRFAETEYEEIERWKMEWAHLLSAHPSKPIHTPHLTTAANDQSTLELSTWFCQLLLHRTANNLHHETDRHVHEILSNARLIITRSLQTRFSAAPGLIDNLYHILGYATLTICDYNPSDQLIDQVRSFLLHLTPNSDHIAYRIAYIVSEMQRRYGTPGTDPQPSPGADVLKNTIFGPPSQPPRSESIDLSHLIPESGSMDTMVDTYGCFEQLLPSGYVSQQGYSSSSLFQQHPAPVTGGAMPVSLVQRAIHDF